MPYVFADMALDLVKRGVLWRITAGILLPGLPATGYL